MPGAKGYAKPHVKRMPYRLLGSGSEAIVVEKLAKSGEPRRPRLALKIFGRKTDAIINTKKILCATNVAELLFPGKIVQTVGASLARGRQQVWQRAINARLLTARGAPQLRMRVVEGINPELVELNRKVAEFDAGRSVLPELEEAIRRHKQRLYANPEVRELLGELREAGILFDYHFVGNIALVNNKPVLFDIYGIEPEKVLRYIETHNMDQKAKNRVRRLVARYRKL